MKALQIMAPERAEVVEVAVPEPGPEQVLVKVLAVNTCPQWDLHIYYGRPMFQESGPVEFPYTLGQPGHEMSGVVAAVGPGVDGFAPGQRVSAWRDQGHERPGCYAQYVIIDAANLLHVPDHLTPVRAASLELAMCVGASLLQLVRADVVRGRRVGVSGLGPAGLVAAQMLRAEGAAEVVGLDLNAERRAFALSLGVDRAVDPKEEGALPHRLADGSLDVSIDCVGYRDSVEYMFEHTRDVVALFGVQREAYSYTQYTLSIFGYPGHSREAAEYALGLMAADKIDLAPLVSCELPLEEYRQGVELLKAQEALKIGFTPWE